MDHRSECPEDCPRFDPELQNPCLWGSGNPSADIMLVGENPGKTEDKKGLPFIGRSGKLLNEILDDLGVSRADIYVSNAVKCYSFREDPKPTDKEVKICKHHLAKEIEEVQPNVVGALGATALKALLDRKGITKLKNNIFHSDEFNVKVIPTYHPAWVLRNMDGKHIFREGIELIASEGSSTKVQYQSATKTQYLVADTPEKIDKVLTELEKRPAFTFDLETNSLEYLQATGLSVGVSWKPGLGITIPWNLLLEHFSDRFRALLLTGKVKANHNIKFDIHVLKAQGFNIKGPIFDTMLAHHLLDENVKHGLEELVLLDTDMGEYWADRDKYLKAVAKERKIKEKEVTFDMMPKDVLYEYGAKDADAAFRLYNLYSKRLKKEGLEEFYQKHTLAFLPYLMAMEYKGIAIDRPKLKALIDDYNGRLDSIKDELYAVQEVKDYETLRKANASEKLVAKYKTSKILKSRYPNGSNQYIKKMLKDKDWVFNFGSPKQLAELLFDHMGLQSQKENKTGPSTDITVLEHLSTVEGVEIADKIVKYRQLAKYISTYLESTYQKSEFDGRIHANYLQHGTVSGRLCVGENTLLQTDHGEFLIKDFPKSLLGKAKIRTHKGRFRKILKKIHKGKEKLYQVTLADGSEIVCTNGHRFLTKEGWRHLRDLSIGSRLFSGERGSNRLLETASSNPRGRGFRKDLCYRRATQSGHYEKIPNGKQGLRKFATILPTPMGKRAKTSKKRKVLFGSSGQYTRKKIISRNAPPQGTVGSVDRQAVWDRTDCEDIKDIRMVRSAKHKALQTQVSRSGLGFNKGNRFNVHQTVGVSLPRDIRKADGVLLKSSSVLFKSIRGLHKGERTPLVYSGIQKSSQLVHRSRRNSKGPYMLESQPRRVTRFPSVINPEYPSRAPVQFLWPVHGGFLFSEYKSFSRDRRIVPRSKGSTDSRCREAESSGGLRLSDATFYNERSAEILGNGDTKDRTSPITSIAALLPGDVWDIEVEEDHSYCAHGFVNHNSCVKPNMQNIPRDAKDFKECFVSDPGYTFIAADLGQAEFRCWAHYSNDPAMIEDIRKADTGEEKDIHTKTASTVFGVELDEVTKEQRNAAKTCVFGMLYGRGPKAISEAFNISISQAQQIINVFFNNYPTAKQWLDDTIARAKSEGYVETWFGRRRRLPNIHSEIEEVQAEAERQAMNSPIQGQVSDMNNIYMVRMMQVARKLKINCYPAMTKHDENVFQVKDDQVEEMMQMMKKVVDKSFPDFACPMKLEFEVGKSLGALKEVII